jgi:hypothetical protein
MLRLMYSVDCRTKGQRSESNSMPTSIGFGVSAKTTIFEKNGKLQSTALPSSTRQSRQTRRRKIRINRQLRVPRRTGQLRRKTLEKVF